MASDDRWLYRTLEVKAAMLERTIQGQGAAGWECVAVSPSSMDLGEQVFAGGARDIRVSNYVIVVRQRIQGQ